MNAQVRGGFSRLAVRFRKAMPQGRGLPAEDWNRRHRGILVIAWLQVAVVPLFGIAQGYGVLHTLAECSVIAIAAAVASIRALSRNVRSAACAVSLLTTSAVLVHFSGGYIEFHFHFFVMIGLLALYQHWLPFLMAIAYVGIHHGLGGLIDPGSVYNHPDGIANPWKWAAIHAGFVLAASAASVFAWHYVEQERERRRDLLRVTEAALSRLPLPELLDEVLLRISEVLKADTATISLWDEDGRLVIEAARGGAPALVGAELAFDDAIAREVSSTGKPAVIDDARDHRLANPVHRQCGVRSLAGVPLLLGEMRVGVLDVGTVEQRRFGSSDLTLLELAAERITPAIDRARLQERDHRIAAVLQRSLLPKTLPEVEGVKIAFRYRPAGESIEAGGDWYDAFALPGGHLGLVIGDVVGHGTDAASLMGQLRTGLRAYAMEGHSPAEILKRLSRLATELGDSNMATVLYLDLDPSSSTLRYSSAGHPPPLLLSPSGRAEYLWDGRGTPIGPVLSHVWPEAEASLEMGSTLVLCTDGLVESREASIDEGLDRLEQTVIGAATLGADALCERVIQRVPAEIVDDDVALMVVRLEPTLGRELRLEYPAVPRSVAAARRALERWLVGRGVAADEAQDVVLAFGEAAANAIAHAYGPGPAQFRLVATQANGEVEVSVADSGRWRPPRNGDTGRGLMFMEKLMDDVEIDRRPDGTTVVMRKRRHGTADVELAH